MTGGIEVPSPQECAPLRTSAHTGTQPLWWVLGAHGGSAASTLAAWWAPAGDAHRAWPAVPGESPYVVIAARATLGGLTAAHGLVRQYLTGLLPAQTALLGVVVTADRPGRVPAPIRLLADKLRALTDDRLWQLDYRNEVAAMLPDDLPAWNIGDAPVKRGDVRDTVPDDVAGVARDITSLIYSREYPPKAGG